jgi:cytidyltransferase-like protein
MNSSKETPIVYVSGGFDDLRTTDIRFLEEASKLGEVHVLLYSDACAHALELSEVKFPLAEREYFLRHIRFVSRVNVIDPDSLDAITLPMGEENGRSAYWVVREKDANNKKAAFCASNGVTFAIIPDGSLAGFAIENTAANHNGAKKVMVSGCFDWVHSGHVRFFEEASQFGDLYVVIGHDANLRLLKGDGHPLFSQEERRYWVQSIRPVHSTLISSGHGWLDAEPEMLTYQPDIFLVNHDGHKPEKQALCEKLGIKYIVLERKPKEGLEARESSQLRGF